MTIEFQAAGPPDDQGAVSLPATVNGQTVVCRFSREVLQEINPRTRLSAPVNQFAANAVKLKAVAERLLRAGRVQDGQLVVLPADLRT